jgi:lipopolysaccharide export system ATP-binding protein
MNEQTISIAAEKNTLRSQGLVKRYKKRTVVNDVSIQVQQGEIVGLLGPNGAGKTTTFYMIVGTSAGT